MSSASDDTFRRINAILDMDVDSTLKAYPANDSVVSHNYLVIDTNTLINTLPLLQSLADHIESHQLPISIVIPGIVVQELDSLKKGFKDSAWRSRVASKWILKKLMERQETRGCIRGQAFTETCLRSGNWKKRSKGVETESNDDLIVDCACYFQRGESKVWVFSGDVQLCAQASMQSILVIYDQDQLTPHIILSSLAQGRAIMPNRLQPPQGYAQGPGLVQVTYGDMDIDEEDAQLAGQDYHMKTIETLHPLDEIHHQLVGHFGDLLKDIAQRAANVERARIEKEIGGSGASIHAPRSTRSIEEVPPSDEIARLSCRECLQYLSTVSPPSTISSLRSQGRQKFLNPSEMTRLANILSLPYAPGARRGRDWTLGDFQDCLNHLKRVGEIWDDENLCESVTICGPAIESAFLGLET